MALTRIDGLLLQQAIVAAARELIYMQDELDRINVFPVADGDTGTNMALTMRDVAETALECKDSSLSGMTAVIANAGLLHARGNSGAILAQFFQGLAEGCQTRQNAGLPAFASAAEGAARAAREAVADPCEGTILTVMADWAAYVRAQAASSDDFVRVFRSSVGLATRSMRENAKRLDVLVRAGVIDAGAQGFVSMLEGIARLMRSGSVNLPPRNTARLSAPVVAAVTDIPFQFCTQILVDSCTAAVAVLTEQLRPFGDSIVIVRSASKARVHIHTNEPCSVVDVLREYGEPLDPRIEDMRAQEGAASHHFEPGGITLITDSSCDLPAEEVIRHRIRVVPFQVIFGDDTFIDKVTITERDFFGMLETSPFHPKTSQPTPAEFLKSCVRGTGDRDALIITVSAGLSGTWQAAQLASRTVQDNVRLHVIDSKSVSGGLALVVREAARLVESGASVEDVRRHVESVILKLRFFVIVETVDFLAKGGRIPRLQARLASLLRLKPMLALDAEGKPTVVARSFGSRQSRRKLMEAVRKEAARMRRCQFVVAHARAREVAEGIAENLSDAFGEENVTVTSISPALGVHVGPGAVAVAFSETG